MHQPSLQRRADSAIDPLKRWIERNGWKGYDPYDILGSRTVIRLQRSGTLWARASRRALLGIINRMPRTARRIAGTQPAINPKGMGLIAAAYCRWHAAGGETGLLEKAVAAAEWLLGNRNREFRGACWGYPFDWQSKVFIPRGTPSAVVTTAVGDAFWLLWKKTRETRYREVCAGICEFIETSLNQTAIDAETVCFSYTPVDRFLVHNANLFAAEFLTRIGKELNEEEWLKLGLKAGNFALVEQNDDGSIYYWGKAQNHHAPFHRDCYHSGFEVRCLWGIWRSTGDARFRDAAMRYLDYFYRSYIGPGGEVMTFPGQRYPLDIHACAEALLCPAVMWEADPVRARNAIRGVLEKTVPLMQNRDGSFAYIAYGPHRIDRTPYLRWGQAWMLRALAEVICVSAQDEAGTGGEKGNDA